MGRHALSIKLNNYRRFAETEKIAFQPGLTIISGPNGAGKSTLIEAFLHTLFGPKGRRTDDIRTDSLNGMVRVECELYIDDQKIQIIRAGSTAELRINDVVQIQGGSGSGKAVTDRIRALLGGLMRAQFERTYIALQGDTAGLVTEKKASDRREVIEKVLQLEVLTTAIELQEKHCDTKKGEVISLGDTICNALPLGPEARELIQSFRNARSNNTRFQHTNNFLKKVEYYINKQKQEHSSIKLIVFRAQEQYTALSKQLGDLKMTIERVEGKYKELESRKERHDALQIEIAGFQGKLDQSDKDIEKYQNAQREAEQYAEIAAEYTRLQTETNKCLMRVERIPLIKISYAAYMQAQRDLDDLKHQLESSACVDDKLKLAKEQEEQAQRNRDVLRDNDPTLADWEAWQVQMGKLQLETQQNREAMNLLKNGIGDARCPTCNQRFIEHSPEHRIQHLTNWLQNILPQQEAQLQSKRQHINEQKGQWKRELQKAEETYRSKQEYVVEIGNKIAIRNTLYGLYDTAQKSLLEKQNAWLVLGEGVPDPQEEATIQRKRQTLTERAEGLKTQADAYTQLPTLQKNLLEKQQEREMLSHQRESLLVQQRALGFDAESFLTTKNYLDQLHEQEKAKFEEVHNADSASKDEQFKEQQIVLQIERSEKFYHQFGTCVQEYIREQRLSEHLEEFKRHFFEENTQQVIKRTTELLMYAITDQSILGVKFDRDDFQYLDASHIAHPIQRLSGGEKSLVGLCLRIALAEQAQTVTRVGRVKFLVLDEVLSSLDEERCEAVKRIFADVLQRGIFEHIIMITHLDTIKQSWQANGLAVQKMEKISTVTQVSPGEVSLD